MSTVTDSAYPEHLETELADAGREVISKKLTWGHSGNFSVRIDAQRFLISGRGARLNELNKANLVVCSIVDPTAHGPGTPSVEAPMHAAVYRSCLQAGSVLHTSAPCTTLVACAAEVLPTEMNTDALHYVGQVDRVAYHRPGGVELGEAVGQAAKEASVLLLSNHGSLVWGASAQDALTKVEALEFLAWLVVTARQARIPFVNLTQEQIRKFKYGT